MIKVNEIIIVEGKYDEIALKQVCDAVVIQTGGFRIFKDPELRSWIRSVAKQRGIIILTDSDGAGFKIRNYISGFVGKKYIKNAYIPNLKGKEKRKERPSAEGFLGVEGVSSEILISALKKAGANTAVSEEKRIEITKTDLYLSGLCGGENSSEKKRKLLKTLGLPLRLSNTKLVEALNLSVTKSEYENLVKEL